MLPALLATTTRAAQKGILPSKTFRFEDLPTHTNKDNRSHPILEGETHQGFPIEVHESDLAPGSMPHPPHRHEHEEIFMIREGTLEAMIAGESTRLGPGSVAYVASNIEHGIRDVGTTRTLYFVMALGQDKKQRGARFAPLQLFQVSRVAASP
jgi:mannose-6-phosphate isomerase-like protein (cupin superfamily)